MSHETEVATVVNSIGTRELVRPSFEQIAERIKKTNTGFVEVERADGVPVLLNKDAIMAILPGDQRTLMDKQASCHVGIGGSGPNTE